MDMAVTGAPVALTIAEVVEVVRRLDARRGLAVSPRQLRYWDTALAFGAGRATDGRNAARMFTEADVAVVRLVRRLQQDEVRDRAIWAILLHLGDDLRRHCVPGTPWVLWVQSNGRAHFVRARSARALPARECYSLADVVAGVRRTIAAVRGRHDQVWNGCRSVSVEELSEAFA